MGKAFYQAGYLYSTIIFALVGLQSYVTSLFILETCARAESLGWSASDSNLPNTSVAICESKYELSYLQHKFLGPRWMKLFLGTTACDLYGITWLICAIFGQALAEKIPLPALSQSYQFWVGVFMLVTVPLSCTSTFDQALLQFLFLGCRMIMVVFMIGTVVVAFMHPDREYFGDQVGPMNDAPLFDFSHTITIIQTAIFSTSFQFSVPGMASVSSNKKSMTGIFRNAVIFVYVSNCVLAVLMALYFGSATNASSNLNWSVYHGSNNGFSAVVSAYVVVFAAVDGLAVFPLMCTSLGDILLAGVYGDQAPLKEEDVKTRIFFRLVASVPQCIGALFVDDLGKLAKYGGVFTIVSYIVAPALLYVTSGRAMAENGMQATTVYSSKWFSKDCLAYLMLTGALLVVIGVVLESIPRQNK